MYCKYIKHVANKIENLKILIFKFYECYSIVLFNQPICLCLVDFYMKQSTLLYASEKLNIKTKDMIHPRVFDNVASNNI